MHDRQTKPLSVREHLRIFRENLKKATYVDLDNYTSRYGGILYVIAIAIFIMAHYFVFPFLSIYEKIQLSLMLVTSSYIILAIIMSALGGYLKPSYDKLDSKSFFQAAHLILVFFRTLLLVEYKLTYIPPIWLFVLVLWLFVFLGFKIMKYRLKLSQYFKHINDNIS